MRPIHEPEKQTKTLRYLKAREQKDERFASLVSKVREIATEFLATPSMMRGAANLIAYEIKCADYVHRQEAAFRAEQEANGESEEDE